MPRNIITRRRRRRPSTLWIEADRLGFVRSQHGAATLDAVRRIVINERRERAEQDPLARLEIQALSALFPGGPPVSRGDHRQRRRSRGRRRSPTSTRSSADMVQPGNATLVLVGDLPAETTAWIERQFGDLPAHAATAARARCRT